MPKGRRFGRKLLRKDLLTDRPDPPCARRTLAVDGDDQYSRRADLLRLPVSSGNSSAEDLPLIDERSS